MRNPERGHNPEQPNFEEKIKSYVEAVYNPENLSHEYCNEMFGLKIGELSLTEVKRLGEVFKETGEIIVQHTLDLESIKDMEQLQLALENHEKQYGKFGSHDLIHVVTTKALNNRVGNKAEDADVPEFLRENQNSLQAIREEFPAVLWTVIGEQRPIIFDIIEGDINDVIETLQRNFSDKAADEIAEKYKDIDHTNFSEVSEAYTEILLHLTYKVAKSESGLEGDELKAWKTSYRADQETVRQSIKKQVQEYLENGKFSEEGRGEQTEQIFIEQAYEIFKNFPTDRKVGYKNFMELADSGK